jgi:serine/threonine-protein kinase HipA
MFNVVARNQDDHVKNIAFLMDRQGRGHLSPAFDVVHAWRPDSKWVSRHQMSLGGKRGGFVREDLLALARVADIKRPQAAEMLDEVLAAARRWGEFAGEAEVAEERIEVIGGGMRLVGEGG